MWMMPSTLQDSRPSHPGREAEQFQEAEVISGCEQFAIFAERSSIHHAERWPYSLTAWAQNRSPAGPVQLLELETHKNRCVQTTGGCTDRRKSSDWPLPHWCSVCVPEEPRRIAALWLQCSPAAAYLPREHRNGHGTAEDRRGHSSCPASDSKWHIQHVAC